MRVLWIQKYTKWYLCAVCFIEKPVLDSLWWSKFGSFFFFFNPTEFISTWKKNQCIAMNINEFMCVCGVNDHEFRPIVRKILVRRSSIHQYSIKYEICCCLHMWKRAEMRAMEKKMCHIFEMIMSLTSTFV